MTDKYKHLFDTEHLKGDLKGKSIRGGASSLIGESVSFALRLGSTVILARLLLPEQFGLVGMATALTGFAHIFKDLGLSDATIQNKDITHEKVSNLFWINAAIGLLIMLIVALSASPIARFYKDQRLQGITLAISSCFFFSGVTVQHQALLYRQMRFSQIAQINVLSSALSIPVGVILAWMGFGYWALVWKEISASALITAGMWLKSGWIPSMPRRGLGVSALLRFGRDMTGFNIVNYFSRSADRILIGRKWGAIATGLYDRASQLMIMPMNQIRFPMTRVGMAGLSAVQAEPEKYRKYFLKLISILCFVYMPIVVYLGIFSESVVRLILGDRWIGAADIFKVLAAAAYVQPIASTCDLVLITHGRTKRYFFWGMANSIWIVTAFAIGVHWGSIGVAYAYTIASYAILLPSLWYRLRNSPISVSVFFRAISLPTIASLSMGAFLVLLSPKIVSLGRVLEIGVSLIFACLAYGGVWVLLPGGKHLLVEYFSYIQALFKNESSSDSKGF